MQANDADSLKKDVFEKVGDSTANGIWTQAKISKKKLGNDTEKFASEERGAVAGYKSELDNGIDISPFVIWDNVSMNQRGKGEADKGEIRNFGIGMVEKVNTDKLSLKFALAYTIAKIGTEREEKGSTAHGEAKVGTGLFGVQAESNWWLVQEGVGKGLKVSPHIGSTVINVNRDSYKETGGKNALEVQSSNMNRVTLDLGLGIEGKVNRKLSWNAGIGADIMLRGSNQDVFAKGEVNDSKHDLIGTEYGNEVPVVSRNIEEGKVWVGGNIGADYKLGKNIKLGANIGVEKGSNYSEVKGNLGVGMKIGTGRDRKAEFRTMERAKERMVLKAKEVTADRKEDIENTFKSKKKKLRKKNEELVKKKKEITKKIEKMRAQSEEF
jgi:hypothetical protein